MKKFFLYTFFAATAPTSLAPGAAVQQMSSNHTSVPVAIETAQISEHGTPTVLAGVGCFTDSDCEIIATGLADVNGSALMSRWGVVIAECVGLTVKHKCLGYVYMPASVKR